MGEFQKKRSDIQCLIYQARTARNHYEIEDCLDLIDDMREVLEKMLMGKCKSCKHWSLPTDDWEMERYEQGGVRPCLKAGLWWEQSYWDKYGKFSMRKDPSILMYVQDGSDYSATLLTDPEFGCIHHEPR